MATFALLARATRRWLAVWIVSAVCAQGLVMAGDSVPAQVAARSLDGVVGIYCMRDEWEAYYGTGVVLTPDGYIITSTTTVPPSLQEAFIHFRGFAVMKAKVVEVNEALECVVLKVDGKQLPCLPVSRALPAIGERAYSLGNAEHLIRLSGGASFSAGIVSGVYEVRSGDSQSAYAGLAIETTAAINPGQDGGPLLNSRGQVIGMISLSFSESRWQGVAVPMTRLLEGLQTFRTGKARVSDRPLLRDLPAKADHVTPVAAHAKELADCLVALTVERKFPSENLVTVNWPRYRGTIEKWEMLPPQQQVQMLNEAGLAEHIINANRMLRRPADPVTGVLISADGLILTSGFNISSDSVFKPRKGDRETRRYEGNLAALLAHSPSATELVANPVQTIRVTLPGGKSVEAKLLAQDFKLGIALLKVAAQGLPHLDLASVRTEPVLGETVGALGIAPGPTRGWTLNEGLVSAVRRDNGHRFQFSALANYGNSGGLVIDARGKVLGLIVEPLRAGEQMMSALGLPAYPKSSGLITGRLLPLGQVPSLPSLTTWQIAPNSGVSFGAPVERILESLPTLTQGRDVTVDRTPYIGVSPRLDTQTAYKDEIILAGIAPGSPAAAAGLAVGDKVLQVNDQPVQNWKALMTAIEQHRVGDTIAITVERKGGPDYVEINGVAVRNDGDLRRVIAPLKDQEEFRGRKIKSQDKTLTINVTLGERK